MTKSTGTNDAGVRQCLIAALTALAFGVRAFADTAPVVDSLTLIDADSDAPIAGFDPIRNHSVINLSLLPSRNLNIRANTTPPTVGSVSFGFQTNLSFRTENGAPYALFGDTGGDYLPWTPSETTYTASATAYSMSNGAGVAGAPHDIIFTVVDYDLRIDAGPDQTYPSSPADVLLGIRIAPPDADIVSLSWSQLAGPPLVPASGVGFPVSFDGLTDGAYVFQVRAEDSLGSVAEDRVTKTVGAPSYSWNVTGELKQWHAVTITFDGPFLNEADSDNPFSNYRLNVEFTNGAESHTVPGYFAADGNAGESGASQGNQWRVHFAPPTVGEWSFVASFRQGDQIAADEAPNAGAPVAFDGTAGSFSITATDKTGRDHRGKGQLRYVGEHYLQFAGTGAYFLKGGADSPENFLAFADFDDTLATHQYAPHVGDWQPGDPQWHGSKGRGVVGALNYLSGVGMNSVYFLTMNVGGDGNDVWPWISRSQRLRYDCSKLDQWDIVFSHMDRVGIALHVVTQETENDQLLDGGALGVERRIYYRELIARFSHHLAVVWNLGEENTNTDAERAAFADFFKRNDPYHHPVVVHTAPGAKETVYAPLLGNPNLDGPSLQIANNFVVSEWVDRSAAAGKPWIVCYDEQAPSSEGVAPDSVDFEHDAIRKEVLWGTLMGGGAGVEYYFGYDFPHDDLTCEDWRSREEMWHQTRIALDFFQTHIPFWQMRHANELTSAAGTTCFADDGALYAIYLPEGQPTSINLEAHSGEFSVEWFNPRVGGEFVGGDTLVISGPGLTPIGLPPQGSPGDWVAVIRACGCSCTCDINGDGTLDGADIAFFVSCATGASNPIECVAADFDQNTLIDGADVTALVTALLCGS